MTDKPQTLAEQIIAMEPPRGLGPASIMREGWNAAIIAAAALADAAATTTPELQESQRRHPMALATWQTWIDDLPLPDDFDEGKEALQEYLYSLAFPDPTPALSWRAMQTAAAEAVAKEAHGETVLGGQRFKTVKLEDAVEAILALPGPTDAQALAEAVKLPEVQAVAKCLDREKSLIWIIENTVQVLIRNLALEMLGQQRAALKAWRDGQRPPSEYEQKLAAMKKDFPNGI